MAKTYLRSEKRECYQHVASQIELSSSPSSASRYFLSVIKATARLCISVTEHHVSVGSSPVSHLGGPGLESQTEDEYSG